MMSEKSLGKPNYTKREKRAFRVMRRVKRQERRPEWMNMINVSCYKAQPLVAEREHIFYPDAWGYHSLPFVTIRLRLTRKLRTIVITFPNRWVARMNRERDVIGSERYVWRGGDGVMKGGQARKESPVIRPGIAWC